MKTTCEVQSAIAGLVQGHIARETNSPFVEATASEGKLTVGVRDKEGAKRYFNVTVEESTEAPVLAAQQSQSQDGTGKAAQATEGCCQGTQTCGEAKTASPAQDEQKAECNEQAAPQDADAREAAAT